MHVYHRFKVVSSSVGVTLKHHGMQLHGDLIGLLWLLGLAHMVLLPDSRIIS